MSATPPRDTANDLPSAAVSPAMLAERLDAVAVATDRAIEAALVANPAPERLSAAIRHAAFAGGKRMRPFLVVESARLFGIEGNAPLALAASLECVHCYSLVHDDLPAMDNDDLRRGKPTVHRAFDEATAILAGDALLTLAFAILAGPTMQGISPMRRLRLVGELARAAGVGGMVGGQMLDLAAEGRFGDGKPEKLGRAAIRKLQSMKTGALISFAAAAGAGLAPRAMVQERRALRIYGDQLGLAFQIRDDLLDIEGSADIMGKAVSKDVSAGKATFVSLLGVAGARRELSAASTKARGALDQAFGARGGYLRALVDFNETRVK